MKDQFVTYKIARRLKELGFNEPCFTKWEKDIGKSSFSLYPILATFGLNGPYKKESNGYDQKQLNEGGYTFTGYKNSILDHGEPVISAPLWQQAIDWLREKHKIDCRVFPLTDAPAWGWNVTYLEYGEDKSHRWAAAVNVTERDLNYYQALTAAINKALELISQQ